ncbi:spinster family MFS transporter [Robiginitalea aurantiaca]|uniref:MFS transporter n=1 Tax=Robiginitalea aurantiaca TaxID=3056915 RepID=A0ABT7WDB5_9FLAO|nr:MFS transporter [Robiginitalea aurantiaca]MDM9630915.1 MFS transporter [Robiginitalea aurantiaca]
MAQTNQNKWVVLAILTLVYTFSFIDRQLLVILAEPVKADLGLSDTQLGLLTGLAFAALYVTLGLPVARLADKGNRKNVVSASLAIWSLMTVISGMATNFVQMLFARIGVGIGEAGGSPPSHSIISDYFEPQKRATALSIYSVGIYIGIFVGFTIGGVLAQHYGWRVAFYAVGIPGVLLAVLIYFFVKEPPKGRFDPPQLSSENLTLSNVVRTLMGKKTFVFIALGSGFIAFGSYGAGNFLPSFLQRVHGVDISKAGYLLGISFGIGGGLGTFLGGYLADKMRRSDMRWYIWLPMVSALLALIPFGIYLFSDSLNVVVWMIFMVSALLGAYLGPAIAVTHSLVSARMRAFSSAVLFLILNIIGLGLGPLTIGFLSDLFQPEYGDLSLRWAFCGIFLSQTLAILFFGLASRHYLKEVLSG